MANVFIHEVYWVVIISRDYELFECVDTLMPGIFLPQQSTWSQSSWPSFPNAQKKRKMKKPCSELNWFEWKCVKFS